MSDKDKLIDVVTRIACSLNMFVYSIIQVDLIQPRAGSCLKEHG